MTAVEDPEFRARFDDEREETAGPPVTRKRRLFAPSLELNAFALMATTGITCLFGLAFWVMAARYPAAEVGRASAVLSTAAMLSVLASLSVGLIFSRFLGSAGSGSRRMALVGYGVGAAGAALLAGLFLLVGPDDELFGSTMDRLAFPILAVILALFALQDWVLISIRESKWVPIEQLVFATLKLGLLAAFVATMYQNGIVLAWALPAGLALVLISPVLFFWVLPNRPAAGDGAARLPSLRGLSRIFVAEYATGVTTILVPMLLPLIVVAQLGTQANAYYAIPWMISEALNLLLWNIYSSYIVEASNDRRQFAALMRRTWKLVWLVGGIGTPFFLLAGPWLLSWLGGEYSAEGSTLLRLLACALPFTIVYSMYISTCRVRQQLGRVVLLQLFSGSIIIGLTTVLLGPMGITGVGVAFLTARMAGAAVIAVPLLRIMRESRSSVPAEPESSSAVAATSQ